LLYAYCVGVRSSRAIERACRQDVAFKVITTMLIPDHCTIAEFRRRHETALGELFVDVLKLCREAGLVSVGVVAIDGTIMSVADSAANLAVYRKQRGGRNGADDANRSAEFRHCYSSSWGSRPTYGSPGRGWDTGLLRPGYGVVTYTEIPVPAGCTVSRWPSTKPSIASKRSSRRWGSAS